MKSLYESILNIDANVADVDKSARKTRTLCNKISKVLHKHWGESTHNFSTIESKSTGTNKKSNGLLHYFDHPSTLYKVYWDKDDTLLQLNHADNFVEELEKIPGIKLNVDRGEFLPDGFNIKILVQNFMKDETAKDFEDGEARSPYPMIVIRTAGLSPTDDRECSLYIGVNDILLTK